MKKLIVLAAVLTLAVTAAFADITVGGLVFWNFTAFGNPADPDRGPVYGTDGVTVLTPAKSGSDAQSSDIISSLGRVAARIQITGQNDDGSFGGGVRVTPANYVRFDDLARAWVWWQPLPILRAQLGYHADFGVKTYVVGWGFNQDAGDFLDGVAGYGEYAPRRNGVFVNGLDDSDDVYAASLVLTPIDGLAISVGVPFWHSGEAGWFEGQTDSTGLAKNVYADTFAQVAYNINGVGEAAVSFDGSPKGQASTLFASFNVSAVENLGLNIGVKYALPVSQDNDGNDLGYTVNSDFKVGFGASYQVNDLFGVKARFYAGFGGNTKPDGGDADPTPSLVSFELQPNFNFGIFTAALNFGMDLIGEDKDGAGDKVADATTKWWITPYITKAIGGGSLWAGVNIVSTPQSGDNILQWAVPIGLMYSF
jgi:hypothetical protein